MSIYGYVSDVDMIEAQRRKEKEQKKGMFKSRNRTDILTQERESLYDLNKEVVENLTDGKDKYLILKISEKDDSIELVPDEFARLLTKPKRLLEENVTFLRRIFVDYDTLFGVRYNQLKNYNNKVFNLQERVLFEALVIKFQRNGFKPFEWPKKKIEYELGIGRRSCNTVLTRFTKAGIIKKMRSIERFSKKRGSPIKTTVFDIDTERIIELLPEIYSNFSREKMEKDILKYLHIKKTKR